MELPFSPPTLLSDELFDSILKDGAGLEELCLDWWDLEACKLEALLKALPTVRCLRLSVRESMLKLVGYTVQYIFLREGAL
jgi:hypothetical protein